MFGTRIHDIDFEVGAHVTFVSDLHLDPRWPEKTAAFAALLAGLPEASKLVIAGDLFEFWLGRTQLRVPAWQEVPRLLEALARRGITCYVLHGNRDFQLDADFERASATTVIDGGLRIVSDGATQLVVLHGDELCANDLAYQKSKRWLRSRFLTSVLHRTPYAWAHGLVQRGRAKSRASQQERDPTTMLVSRAALAEVGRSLEADLLFGHVHQAASDALPGSGRHYFVLPEFESERYGHARWIVGASPRLVLRGREEPWPGGLDLSA